MTFLESVRTCLTKYADFNGRASRPEFWWWVLFNLIASMALGIISEKLSGVFSLAMLLPYIAVTTRRLHDTDRSGWFQLLVFLPVIGWIVLIIWYAQQGKEPNRFTQSDPA
jgi:uncharacterized membrane protein YhaH (DUF805 family)